MNSDFGLYQQTGQGGQIQQGGERLELRARRVGELLVRPSQSPGPERRSRLSSPLLQRRQPGFPSPASQRRSLEVSSPRVPPGCYSTSSLQRRRPDTTDQPHLHNLQPPHYSPQVNRRSVPLEQNSPYLQRRLTLERSSITVLASLDKSILQIR